jgi:kynureninase
VIVDVPNGAAVADELIRRGIVIDHRPGAGIRIAPHFYNTEEEIDRAVAELIAIAELPPEGGRTA